MRPATLTGYIPTTNAKLFHDSDARDVLIIAPKRSGKTYSLRWDILKSAWNNRYGTFYTLVTAPTYKHLWTLLEQPLVDMFRHHGLLSSHNKSEHVSVLRNGNRVVYRSIEDANAIEGLDVACAYTDEFTICKEEACDAVQSRVLLTNGRYVRAGTPKGTHSWAYAKYFEIDEETGVEKFHAYKSLEVVKYAIQDNPHITEEAIARAKSQLDPLSYRQDILAEWVNLTEERVYHSFNSDLNVQHRDYNRNEQTWVFVDYNIGINAWLACQRDQFTRSLYVIDEGSGAKTTKDLAAQITVRYGSDVYLIDDASGGIRQQGDAYTQRQILRQCGLAKLMQPLVNPERQQRYANVNANFENGLGQRHLFISPKCKRVIAELNTLCYKPRSDFPDDRGGKVGHITDALGYGCWYLTGGRVPIHAVAA